MEDDSLELVRQDLTELEYDTAAVCKKIIKDVGFLMNAVIVLGITNAATLGLFFLLLSAIA